MKDFARYFSANTFVWAGVVFAVINWLAESALHVWVFHEGSFRSQVFTSDPHELWMRLVAGALLIFFGFSVQQGINLRRRTEEALKTSERKYRAVIEEALNPVFVFDAEGRFLDVNEASLQFFELDRDQLLSTKYQEIPGSLDLSTPGNFPFTPVLGQTEVDFPIGGATKTLLLNIVPLPMSEDAPSLYYGIGQDITDRKQAEHDLELAHEEVNQIFQTASSAMRLIDRDFNVLKVNETFVNFSGVSRDDSVGTKCFDVFAGDRCHTDQCPMKRILQSKQEIEFEIRDETRIDGSEVSCLLTARPFVNPDGETIGIVESFKDITEITKAQKALQAESDKLQHILFQQFEGVSILRTDHTIEYQNETLTKEIGDCSGVPCYTAFKGTDAPCSTCYMHKAIETGKLQRCEFEVDDGRTLEHTYTPFSDTNSEEKVVVYLRDITEMRASRAAAIRAEQLAGVGELAAGVAHEINNPINGIINYAQMLINSTRGSLKVGDIGERIVKEGDRVARIVASLLSFARRGSDLKVLTSIDEILSESLTLVGTQIRKDSISLDVDVAHDLPPVNCIPQEIQQVFLNILNNARFALNASYLENGRPKKLAIFAILQKREDDWVIRISFRDSGTGIAPDIVDKVMSPFFSTKPRGKGTGLGLSISQDIVHAHGGDLTIESADGEFTTVSVELPAVVM